MNLKTVVTLAAVLAASPALAQTQAESDQIKQIASSGVELLKRTPVTGPVEAQILLNVNSLLSALSGGQLLASRPAPAVPPAAIQGLKGGPALDPSPKVDEK